MQDNNNSSTIELIPALQSLERSVIENCAPTLAGIKSGNLYSYFFYAKGYTARDIMQALTHLNRILLLKGVCALPLKWTDKCVLFYVYRKSHLIKDLKNTECRKILKSFGYPCSDSDIAHFNEKDLSAVLRFLCSRISSSECFPHEIGLFLSYPVEDVKGFINHKGADCKMCGLWKVYGDTDKAISLFRKYRHCSQIYMDVYTSGRSLNLMTVSA